jgi:twinkle protein
MKMNWDRVGIDPKKVTGGKTYCPKCHHARKHKKDKSLSVNLDTGMFNCHNPGCEYRGCAAVIEKVKKEYVKPLARLEKLSSELLQRLENDRGISNNTLLRFKITEAKEWMPQFEREVRTVCFNYFRNGELVNIKFRGPQKSFKMAKDAELIFYNLDAIKDEDTAVIVEGEIDCLTMHECGIYNSVSVPNGASPGSLKLEYLDNCWEYFVDKKKIILATDADEPGLALREELARRLGKERCFTVQYPDNLKDANEVKMKFGKDAVKQLIEQAKEWPLEGIAVIDDLYDTLERWYNHGYPQGDRSQVPGLDSLLTFAPRQVTTITGIPGHGKDEYTNWIMAGLTMNAGWKWGDCGFEEEPEQTVSKIIEKITGKSFDFRKNPDHRMSVSDFERGIAIVEKNFFFYKSEEIETDIDSLLGIADRLVLKYGIRGLRLNPWNWIENNTGIEGTEYVSVVYTKIIKWARKRNVHVFVVAHTTKIGKDKNGKFEIPNLYNISGSAHFFNKTHNGLTVYLDYVTRLCTVYVQKVKQSWLGQKGYVTYSYNVFTRQYELKECQPENIEYQKVQQENHRIKQQLGPGNWVPLEMKLPYADKDENPF